MILAGILSHLENPIGEMKRIFEVTTSAFLIDSHVYYSTDQSEDIPFWRMLNDMDENEIEGLFVNNKILLLEEYLKFETDES